jgi:ribosomal protein L36
MAYSFEHRGVTETAGFDPALEGPNQCCAKRLVIMKVRASVKICDKCKVIHRRGGCVICVIEARQRQG